MCLSLSLMAEIPDKKRVNMNAKNVRIQWNSHVYDIHLFNELIFLHNLH